jgi:DNA-binding GntR family transcriptional regulator
MTWPKCLSNQSKPWTQDNANRLIGNLSVNTSSSIPQYQQVADTLRQRIARAEYRVGDVIPTSRELEELFSVSNITIRKALAILSDEGLVASRRGIGTVIKAAPQDLRLNIAVSGDFSKWVDTASGKSLPIRQKILSFQILPGPERVTRQLGLQTGAPLWTLRRLRWVNNDIISYHVNFSRPEILAGLDDGNMTGDRNFVDMLREDTDLQLKRMDQTVEAAATDRDLAQLLGVNFGTPLFFVENIYIDKANNVAAVTHLYLRGDRYTQQTSIDMDTRRVVERKGLTTGSESGSGEAVTHISSVRGSSST